MMFATPHLYGAGLPPSTPNSTGFLANNHPLAARLPNIGQLPSFTGLPAHHAGSNSAASFAAMEYYLNCKNSLTHPLNEAELYQRFISSHHSGANSDPGLRVIDNSHHRSHPHSNKYVGEEELGMRHHSHTGSNRKYSETGSRSRSGSPESLLNDSHSDSRNMDAEGMFSLVLYS